MKRIMTVATLMLVSILAMAQMQTPVHFSVSQKHRQGLARVFHRTA